LKIDGQVFCVTLSTPITGKMVNHDFSICQFSHC